MKPNTHNIGEVHSFSRTLAKEHGIHAAILLSYFAHQIPIYQTARKDDLGFYTSVKNLSQHYPYLTANQIEYTLLQLRKGKVLKTGNHNRRSGDKTLWYKFADPEVQKMALEDPVRFNVEIAKHYGVEAALILTNIKYWIHKNEKKDAAFNWLRVSARELAKHLPIPARTISRDLLELSVSENRVLERKPSPGFDQAFYYRFRIDLNCDGQDSVMGEPNSGFCDQPELGIRKQESAFHEPVHPVHEQNHPLHEPKHPTHEPELRTITSYIETVEKKSVEKNNSKTHLQTAPASPDECVCHFHSFACGAPNAGASLLPAPAIAASGEHSERNQLNPADSNIVAVSEIKSVDAHSCAFDDEDELAAQELDASLPSLAKAGIFMAGVRKMNSFGSGIVYDKKSIEKARHFFELNPALPTRPLLDVLETCVCLRQIILPVESGEYDYKFHVRRSNNLNFFFKYLGILSSEDVEGNLAGCVFEDVDSKTLTE